MGLNSSPQTVVASQTDGTAITDSTTAASIIPAKAKFTFPIDFFEVGSVLRVTATGRISCVVTTPGTLTLDLRMNDVIAATTDAMALCVVAKTSVSWWLDWLLTCQTVGDPAGTKFSHLARFTSQGLIGSPVVSVGGNATLLSPAATPGQGTGFNLLASNTLDMFGKFSVNTTGTSIQCHQFVVETLINNPT